MARARPTVFTSNKRQAVRLPKSVALPANVHQVEIAVIGRSRLISPVGHSWDSFFETPPASKDEAIKREQPAGSAADGRQEGGAA